MLGFNKKTQDASPQENTGGENKVFHFIKTHKKRCIAVVAAAAVLVDSKVSEMMSTIGVGGPFVTGPDARYWAIADRND